MNIYSPAGSKTDLLVRLPIFLLMLDGGGEKRRGESAEERDAFERRENEEVRCVPREQ